MTIEAVENPLKAPVAQDVVQRIGLPSIHEHPQSDVVIFDGNCQFCQKQVQRLAWFDRSGKLAFVSLHDPLVAERYADLTHDQLMQQMVVIDAQGNRHGGAAAIRYLSRRLPRLWFAAPFLHIPLSLPFWSWAYNQIAKRRYRWNKQHGDGESGCDNGTCDIHFGD